MRRNSTVFQQSNSTATQHPAEVTQYYSLPTIKQYNDPTDETQFYSVPTIKQYDPTDKTQFYSVPTIKQYNDPTPNRCDAIL